MLYRTSLMCFLLCTAVTARGQDPFGGNDPFGGGATTGTNDPFGTGGTSDPASGFGAFGQPGLGGATAVAGADSSVLPAEEDPDPIVRMLRASPPNNAQEMADGLTWLARIQRWDEAKRLLDELAGKQWSLQQRAVLARAAGPTVWLRLRADEVGLSDAQRKTVTDVLTAPATLARDPAWLDQWIAKLGSSDPGERRLAQLRLQDGSTIAVQRLVTNLLDGNTKVPPVMLAGTALEFGQDGIDALRTACLVRDTARVTRVLDAIAQVPGNTLAAELGAGLTSRVLPPEAINALSATVAANFGNVPNDAKIDEYLKRKFEAELANYQTARTATTKLSTLVWRVSADGQNVQSVEAPADHRELERVSQLAALRLQTRMSGLQTAIDCGTVLLQRAYQVQPTLQQGEFESQLLANVGDQPWTQQPWVDQNYWENVFAKCEEWQMHGGALRAVQAMAEAVDEGDTALNFLSDLLHDPRPMIRYTALETLAKINPQREYRGAEQAIKTALEMSHLTGGAGALVVGLQSELRQVAQQQIEMQTAARVMSVNSGRAALLALQENEPVEMIFVVDRVSDQSLFELLQRLRHTNKGYSLPIAVMTDELYSHERDWIRETPGVVGSVLSRNADHMKRIIDRMQASLDTQPMTPADRASFAQVAGEFLSSITANREQLAFYHVGDWREELASTAATLGGASQIQVLSGLGTRESQERLVKVASMTTFNQAERLAAASAFGTSVKSFGLRLNKDDVLHCYELYNQLGPRDEVAARTLAFVLDAIEAHAGQKAWPVSLE